MKDENETGVKSMSEGSEGARPRWFWHLPAQEQQGFGKIWRKEDGSA